MCSKIGATAGQNLSGQGLVMGITRDEFNLLKSWLQERHEEDGRKHLELLQAIHDLPCSLHSRLIDELREAKWKTTGLAAGIGSVFGAIIGAGISYFKN